MTDTFDAVLADVDKFCEWPYMGHTGVTLLREWRSRLSAAHAAEVVMLQEEVSGLRAARLAYANEFPPNDDGEPDVGSVHANLRALKARAEAAERDARRYRWLRDRIAPEELTDEVVALFALRTVGPIADRTADDDSLDEMDAAIDAAIATTEQADED